VKYYTLKHNDFFVAYCGLDGSLNYSRGGINIGDNLSTDYGFLNRFAEFWNKENPLLNVNVVEVELVEKRPEKFAIETILGVQFFDEGYRFD
jgi:hypothetical protein